MLRTLRTVAVLAVFLVSAVPVVTAQGTECINAPEGMVGWWPGDGDATDIQGGNDGAPMNGAAFGPGKVADAFLFDGADDHVVLPGTFRFDRGEDFTLDLWVRQRERSDLTAFIVDTRLGTVYGTAMVVNSSGNVIFSGRCDNADNTWYSFSAPLVFPDDTWHHVAAVIAWNVNENRLYVDGNLAGVGDLSLCDGFTRSDKFYLGAVGNLDSRYMLDGGIDEVEVFDRALDAAEIQAIYAAGSAGKCKEGPCDPAPLSQGYWHRQCLGVSGEDGGIDPGRNGRGPQEPLESGFVKDLMGPVGALLGDRLAEFGGACAGGMDADPPSDSCQRALKQTTALLFNRVSGRLSGSCQVDLSAEGCGSENLLELVGELAGLINSGDPSNCQTAAACAAAANEGTALESAAVMAVEMAPGLETDAATISAATVSGTTDSAGVRQEMEWPEPAGSAAAPRPPAQFLMVTPQVPEAEAPATRRPEDTVATLERHLAVVSNRSAPARAVKVSTDALLTALSGGYDPEIRLEIVKGLLGRLDVAYYALVVAHIEEIRAEAEDFKKEDLVREATRLLGQLEPALE